MKDETNQEIQDIQDRLAIVESYMKSSEEVIKYSKAKIGSLQAEVDDLKNTLKEHGIKHVPKNHLFQQTIV